MLTGAVVLYGLGLAIVGLMIWRIRGRKTDALIEADQDLHHRTRAMHEAHAQGGGWAAYKARMSGAAEPRRSKWARDPDTPPDVQPDAQDITP